MKLRTFVAGLITGVVLATTATAFGASAIQKISAQVRNDFTVKVDGQKTMLQNPPILYNDRTYVPLRELGEMLGKDVGFDGKTNTVTLDKKKGEPMIDGKWISLNALATDYGLIVTVGDNVTIGELKFPHPGSADRVIAVDHNGKEVLIKILKGRYYVDPINLKEAGLL